MEKKFEKVTFSQRIKSMLTVDFRRMFTMPLFYIMAGIAIVMPVLILVMTTMMDGSVSVNPTTGEETVMESFKNIWQMIGSLSGLSAESSSPAGGMDIVSMCNINLIFFMTAVLVCLFVGADFKSGYTKNLFTVRSNKTDYVISKTVVCFACGALMLIGFFIGSMIGGAISNVSFAMEGFNVGNIIMCMLAKIFLMLVFVALYSLMAVIAKQKIWLSILLSLGVGMLLFTMIPMITPLNSNFLNVILCIAGGAVFSIGLGAISRILLKKRDVL